MQFDLSDEEEDLDRGFQGDVEAAQTQTAEEARVATKDYEELDYLLKVRQHHRHHHLYLVVVIYHHQD